MRGHVRKRGNTWSVVIDLGTDENGRRRQKWHSGFRTKRDATRGLTEILARLQSGTYVEPRRQTVAEYLREWLPAIKSTIRPGTWSSYRVNMERHVIPRIGHVPLRQLGALHLNSLYADLLSTGRCRGDGRTLSEDGPLHPYDPPPRSARRGPVGLADPDPSGAGRSTEAPGAGDAGVGRRRTRGLPSPRPPRAALRPLTPAVHHRTTTRRGPGPALGRCRLGRRPGDDPPDPRVGRRDSLVLDAQDGQVTSLGQPRSGDCLRASRTPQGAARGAPGVGLRLRGPRVGVLPGERHARPTRYAHPAVPLPCHWCSPRTPARPRHTYATIALTAGTHPKVVADGLGHATIAVTLDTYSHVIPTLQEQTANELASLILGHEPSVPAAVGRNDIDR